MVFQILTHGVPSLSCFMLWVSGPLRIQKSVSRGSCSGPAGPLVLVTDWCPGFPLLLFCCHFVWLAVLETESEALHILASSTAELHLQSIFSFDF